MQNKKLTLSLVASCLLATNLLSNEIYVTSATKSEQSIKDVTSNVEVITKADIEERNYSSVSEALNTLTGVDFVSNGGVGQLDSIYIRGIESKRILVLIDGMRYNEPSGLNGAPIAQLNMNDIHQIEVIKGAQSGIWGADASGGVINIITTKLKKGFSASIKSELGSFQTKKISTSIGNRFENGYIKVNVDKTNIDGFSAFQAKKSSADYGKRGDELGYEKDGYINNTYSISAGLDITSKDEINILYKNIKAKYDYDDSNADNINNTSNLDHNFISSNIIHREKNFNIKFQAQRSKFDRTQNTFIAKSKVDEFFIQSEINYVKDALLIVGLDKQNFKDIKNKTKYNTKAAFFSNSNKFGNLILNQTMRYDDNSKFEEKITGKLGAKYQFTKDLSTSANYGTAYNAPTISNLGYTPSLKPETTKSYDLNIEYKNLKFTYFENRITNLIQYVPNSFPNIQYENLSGESKSNGYEVTYKKDIIKDTYLGLNYTHLSAKDADGKDLARRAKNQVNLSLDFYGLKNTHINLNGQYIGTRYDEKNKAGAQTGRYTVWNSVVNYDINKNLKTYLKVDNLFDKYYQTVDGYATSPRAFYVGLKATF